MGRRKIQIKPIKEDRNRYVTFIKRKAGLFKKAHELAVLCQVDLALVVVTPEGKVFEYSSAPDAADVFHKRQALPLVERKRPSDYGFESGNPMSGEEEGDYEDDEESSEHERSRNSRGSLSDRVISPTSNSHSHIQQHHSQQQQHPSGPYSEGQSSRPRLKVKIPTAQEDPNKQGPGPLTALAATSADPVGDVPHPQMQQQSMDPNHPPRHDPTAIGPEGSNGTSIAQRHHQQHGGQHRGSSPSSTDMNQASGPSISQQNQIPMMAGPVPVGVRQGQPAGTPQQHLLQAPPYAPRMEGQRAPMSPSGYLQGYQPAMNNQAYFNGVPVGYNYSPVGAAYGPGTGTTPTGPPQQQQQQQQQHQQQQQIQQQGRPNSNNAQNNTRGNMPGNPPSANPQSSTAGRWGAYPQSPMACFVSPAGEQQKTEPGPISAAMPSRYMNEMLSPSNYFSMEWGVWDPQASAVPGGTARVIPPYSGQPSSENKPQDSSPSPVKHESSASEAEKESKRRKTSQ